MTTEELLKKAEEVIKLLKESKLSNYVISKQTHISQSTLGNYKNGKTKPTNVMFINITREDHMKLPCILK